MQNGIYLGILVAVFVWVYRSYGWEGVPGVLLTIFGIGFIIFIHELGHFAVAKWCDVHVMTFSIGFGPAIPGCSFKRGETTYKLSLLPLGGYVNMVGEGSDADENEDYPRSFKNKTVGQRMAIISAGVIMNVILGAICFIFVYRAHGVERPVGVIGGVDPGGVAWTEDVRPGWKLIKIGDIENPMFDDLQHAVILSAKGKVVSFTFLDPETGKTHEIELQPRRLDTLSPIIGVTNAKKLVLIPPESKKYIPAPTARNSAAAAARVVDLKPGDVVRRATNPNDPRGEPTDVADLADVARRFKTLDGEPLTLVIRRKNATKDETVELAPEGFLFGDRFVGCSKVAKDGETYDPLDVAELPDDPRFDDDDARDYFAFLRQMRALAGEPVVIEVERDGKRLRLLVPPAFHARFGARMQMGVVAAVRAGSDARDKAGVRGLLTSNEKPDVITGVRMFHKVKDAGGKESEVDLLTLQQPARDKKTTLDPEKILDPITLPRVLAKAAVAREARGQPKWVELIVNRRNPKTKLVEDVKLPEALSWDESHDDSSETPFQSNSPMSIPQLGIAYWVNSTITGLEEKTPALLGQRVTQEKKGVWTKTPAPLRVDDTFVKVRFWEHKGDKSDWGSWNEMVSERGEEKVYDTWANTFKILGRLDSRFVQFVIKRDGSVEEDEPVEVLLEEDTDWPMAERGFRFDDDRRLYKADSTWEALGIGTKETWRFIVNIYKGLQRVITGQISTKTFGGPIEIVSTTFTLATDDLYKFILFMGILSINLAVVNFLPIPLLDGGHMVFLIYEKIRGKPASENVRAVAAYIGLAMLLALMVYVFVLDIQRRIL